jgi:hypothetical protein
VTDDGYVVHSAFLKDTLTGQDDRKSSIEQRGLGVITTAGTLVTLLFAIIGLATKREQTFTLPSASHGWLAATVILLGSAVLGGLVTNVPLNYVNVDEEGLDEIIDDFWDDNAEDATTRIAVSRKDMIVTAMRRNNFKAWALFIATGMEVAGLVTLAVAVLIILDKA